MTQRWHWVRQSYLHAASKYDFANVNEIFLYVFNGQINSFHELASDQPVQGVFKIQTSPQTLDKNQ